MNFKETIDVLIKADFELSLSDLAKLQEFIRLKCEGFELCQKKQFNKQIKKTEANIVFGENSREGYPYNPINGILYKDKVMNILLEHMVEQGLCGQFAGQGQWNSVGRVIKNGKDGIFTGKHFGNKIYLYPVEYTE